jgi:CHAT domain-containing protein
MKAVLKALVCLVLACLGVQAQTKGEDERAFERAVNQYTVDYQDLMRTRGGQMIPLEERRRIRSTDALREISDSFLSKGAPPLSERYVDESSLNLFTRALRNNFSPDTALLFYAYQEGALRIWLINQEGLRAYSARAMTEAELEALIYAFRNALGVDSLQSVRAPLELNAPKPLADIRLQVPLDRAIDELTGLLLPPPIAEQLAGVRHLIVAPILGIGTIPFAVLRPFKSETFLIEKMSVSIVPNLFDIADEVKPWRAEYRAPLIVGNPYFPKDDDWRVPQLPGAEDEALAIGRMMNTRPLTGRSATKRRVLLRARGADFLFLATHGIASSDAPLTGGFLFLTARNLKQGFWTAKEIQRSRLSAQLAVLSACQTGLGKIHDAGVIGLSRAFQIAGVPRVVMSLWSVYDKATAELMKAFVKYLKSNMPAEALRLAMLDVKRERPQVVQWASFVLFGTPR